MKKTIEVNPKFNVGDIVYVMYNNRIVKGKVKKILYDIEDDIIRVLTITDIRYSIIDLEDEIDMMFFKNYDNIFKSKDDAIDYLKTQIDKITTDDYNINFNS